MPNEAPELPTALGSAAACRSVVSAERRWIGEKNLLAFARAYLPHLFSAPPASFHAEVAALLRDASVGRDRRLAIAAPRSSAKSTLCSTAYALWSLAYGRERYIMLISHTADQAVQQLGHLKHELLTNPRLREDFPDLCRGAGDAATPSSVLRWTKDEIVTATGIRVAALGAEQKIRGRRHREHRPTMIILDDFESEESVRSAEQREKRAEWLDRAVLKAGEPGTNVIAVGTILHYDALLARLTDPAKSPGWVGRKFKSVISFSERQDLWDRWSAIFSRDEEFEGRSGPEAAAAYFQSERDAMLAGTEVLWPEREPYDALMRERMLGGRAAFDAEKQNEPTDPSTCFFPESEMRFWDDDGTTPEALLARLSGAGGSGGVYFGACDPSLGRAGKHRDDTAIVSILLDRKTGVMYVVDADIRRRKPDQTIDDIITYNTLRRYEVFAIEANQFQDFLGDELIRRSQQALMPVPARKVTHTSDKLGRIQKLQPLVTSGMLRFSRRHRTLLEQMAQFPRAAHDDGPDALAMAVTLTQRGVYWGAEIEEPPKRNLSVLEMFEEMRKDPEWGNWTEIGRW